MELGDVDPQEQQQIMRDFVRHTPQRPHPKGPAVELDPSLAEKLRSHATSAPTDPTRTPVEWSAVPFSFLDRVDAEELAQALVREHPQTTAIIIAHLPPSRAADVLRRLPSSLQSVALIRIARLETPSHDVVSDVEHEMQCAAAEPASGGSGGGPRRRDDSCHPGSHVRRGTPGAAGRIVPPGHDLGPTLWRSHRGRRHSVVHRDLDTGSLANAMRGPPVRSSISGVLPSRGRSSRSPPTRPARDTLTFADLEKLEDAALAHVLHVSSPHTALLALAGASHDFVQRILQQLPVREAGVLRRKMQQLGPIRLDDVEFAQLRLADVAQRLIENGEITMPSIERFAVAA